MKKPFANSVFAQNESPCPMMTTSPQPTLFPPHPSWQADCLFCKILAGQIPAKVVFKTESVLVFEDIAPQAPTHWLAIHTHHTASHSQTTEASIFADLLHALQQAAQQHGVSDYRLVINNGAGAGQTVFHTHVHLMAGRPLAWPAG